MLAIASGKRPNCLQDDEKMIILPFYPQRYDKLENSIFFPNRKFIAGHCCGLPGHNRLCSLTLPLQRTTAFQIKNRTSIHDC
jgi:hypothetical protein